MKRRAVNFPSGIAYSLPFDTTRFVSASITEVYTTLIEASVLVLLVIVVFLQSWRATLVPATTVPVTIIGAFAAMAALGFSVNLLTLFALVLAIGIVVDDAIIVVEGSAKYIERGMEPKQAAALAMDELLRPILAITLVLLSVFLPASILPGIVGQLYRQFALVIAATAVISAINAVTLKPTQCALWLRPRTDRPNAFYRGFNFVYDRLERGYAALVQRLVRFPVLVSLVAVALSALAIGALTRLPTAFIPTEDQGYMLVGTQLPDGASLERTQRAMARVTEIARNIPGVEHVVTVGGASLFDNSASLANAGIAYVILKDWSRRGAGEDPLTIFKALQSGLDTMQDASAIVIPPPPIQGLGLAGGFQMQVQVTDGTFDYRKLQQVADRIVELGNAQPALTRLMAPCRASAQQLGAEIDRREAEALGVNVGDAFQAIQTYLGSTYVSQFSRFGHTFPVFVQADTRFRLTFEALGELNVRNSKGAMVPVGTLASVKPGVGPALIPLYNLNPSATINGVAAPGYSSGQALKLMDEIAASALPPGMSYGWTGVSYQEAALGNQSYWIFGLALLLVLMVLAGQYESWSAPLAVVIAVPLALLGTVAALMVAGVPNNIYTQIGLVLLIALSSKNAILIVEFARELRLREGQTIEQAAVEASRVRFRPILMTSIAFILGVLPLVFATGAGAAARRSIGITVFSGMLASTCIAVMFVPALFVVLQRWSEWRRPASVPKKGAT
jgi:hydrophobic/amphiphilic exporter-1 (mainly G- bacteria), HAE1 family